MFEFYGLTGKPFQLTPDPAFYFPSATHRQALACLGYALAQGEGFVVVTGAAGAGKSMLAAHLAGTVDPRRLTLAQLAGGGLDAEDMACRVARAFGLTADRRGKGGALAALEEFLREEAQAGRRSLLVVDEAQALPATALEELRLLSNLQLGNHPLLQTLLLGEPAFCATLQSLDPLRQRVIATHHLGPMAPDETEAYVCHRLECVGWTGHPQFEPGVFAAIHAASGGIPREINLAVNRLLLLGAVEQADRIGPALFDLVLEALVAEAAPPSPGTGQTPPSDRPLAECEAQIAELQQAVAEIAARHDTELCAAVRPDIAALQDEVARLGARLFELERTMRHVLTMLIEWIESDAEHAEAA